MTNFHREWKDTSKFKNNVVEVPPVKCRLDIKVEATQIL